MDENSNDTRRPMHKHRDGALEVAIWRRETEKGPVFNTERTRSYRDENGNWQKTNVVPERDLLRAARLDQKAYETIQSQREKEREAYVKEQSRPRRSRNPDRER